MAAAGVYSAVGSASFDVEDDHEVGAFLLAADARCVSRSEDRIDEAHPCRLASLWPWLVMVLAGLSTCTFGMVSWGRAMRRSASFVPDVRNTFGLSDGTMDVAGAFQMDNGSMADLLGDNGTLQEKYHHSHVTRVAGKSTLWGHEYIKAGDMKRIRRGHFLASLDMRSWNCRAKCMGGGCCNEGDCVWSCKKDPRYSRACKTYSWSQSAHRCDLFTQAGHGPWISHIRPEGRAPLLEFYAYRAMTNQHYDMENVDMANLAGEMYYLNHEIVSTSCPRNRNITRVVRFKVTMRAPLALYNSGPGHPNWLIFQAFDVGGTIGQEDRRKWGWAPGCMTVTGDKGGDYRYKDGIWYSFPGRCPSRQLGHKDDHCKRAEPGGKCRSPTGEFDCTWNLEPAGEITIEELTGIHDYGDFCHQHKKEYVEHLDRGSGFHFWDERHDPKRCAERVRIAEEHFHQKYPHSPRLHEPVCKLAGHW